MPLEIQHLVGKEPQTIPVYIEAADASCSVSYDPLRYGWEIERRMVEDGSRLPAGTIHDFLLTFVVSWDLTHEGEPIPVTAEGLDLVDFSLVQVPIANAIMEDMGEGKARKTPSPRRSPTEMTRRRKSTGTAVLPDRP